MNTVIDWLSRLTAYGYIDLGSDVFLVIVALVLLSKVDQLLGRVRQLEADLAWAGDDSADDQVEEQPLAAPGPATVPAATAIDTAHAALVKRELDGYTFSFRSDTGQTTG